MHDGSVGIGDSYGIASGVLIEDMCRYGTKMGGATAIGNG